jgi:hypothetical protein
MAEDGAIQLGTEVPISLMHSADGKHHACCICFEWFTIPELEPVSDEPGKVWDVCRSCAETERQRGDTY